MSAKIKQPMVHHASPRPKGSDRRKFEKVYWPFVPVLVVIGLLLASAVSTGSLASFIKHPGGKVLSYAVSENANAMLIDTNAQRQKYGEPLLQVNAELSSAAAVKAKDMATRNYFSHYAPDGSPPWSFATAAGYSYQAFGENLATGFGNEQAVINAWMASMTHRQNLLDPSFSQVGFGFANSSHYTAIGGQPATIFVAFYAQPAGAVPLANIRPASASTISANSGGTQASAVSGGFGSSFVNGWAPDALVIVMACSVLVFAVKHFRKIWRYVYAGERFVWQHPIFDAGIVAVIALSVVLWQNVGLIK